LPAHPNTKILLKNTTKTHLKLPENVLLVNRLLADVTQPAEREFGAEKTNKRKSMHAKYNMRTLQIPDNEKKKSLLPRY
jgi:hypothetical protein